MSTAEGSGRPFYYWIRDISPRKEPCLGTNRVRDEERIKERRERAEVFGFDLNANSVETAVEWAKVYRDGQTPEDSPVCIVAYGREIEPEEQARLALAGIYTADVTREGFGPWELPDSVKSYYRDDIKIEVPGYAILADIIRSAIPASPPVAADLGPSQPAASATDWMPYTEQPNHVPASDLKALFEELARDDRDWWEQDS